MADTNNTDRPSDEATNSSKLSSHQKEGELQCETSIHVEQDDHPESMTMQNHQQAEKQCSDRAVSGNESVVKPHRVLTNASENDQANIPGAIPVNVLETTSADALENTHNTASVNASETASANAPEIYIETTSAKGVESTPKNVLDAVPAYALESSSGNAPDRTAPGNAPENTGGEPEARSPSQLAPSIVVGSDQDPAGPEAEMVGDNVLEVPGRKTGSVSGDLHQAHGQGEGVTEGVMKGVTEGVMEGVATDTGDSGDDYRNGSTEDEASDWEMPVDVELDISPARRRQPNKASWSAVKAISRWLPMAQSKMAWTQMAGHKGSFVAGPKGCVLKLLVSSEERNLQLLMNEDQLSPFVPRYHHTVQQDGQYYIQLQDLLCEFTCPCVMDIKMGVRTYLEEELTKARKKPTLRKDLYQKMVSLDPEAPTEEEREQQAVLKPRYMKYRDDMSSTSLLGFRIEGIKTGSGASKDFKDTRTREQVKKALLTFVENNSAAIEKYPSLLIDISKAQESSEFFNSHEMVGSSLLFVHDDSGKAGVWMIDFAKCSPLPSGVSIDHRAPWTPGNYQDGYWFGLDNLISIFQDIASSSSEQQSS